MSDIIKDTKSRMQKSIDNLSRELANISAGRANPIYLMVLQLTTMVHLHQCNN